MGGRDDHADGWPVSGFLSLPRRGPLATAMLAGIGITIALWLAAGVDLAWRFEQVDLELTALTDRVLRSEQALESIRNSVLLGAVDWRDALLDSGGAEPPEFYRARIRQHQATCTSSLADVRTAGDPEAVAESLAQLGRELDEYWASIYPIMTEAPVQRAADLRQIMRERVLPRRANIERIVAHVQTLNRLQFEQQQRREAEVYARSRTRFLLTGGLALLLSLGVGVSVTGYVGRLERALRAHLAANARNAADLHNLSGRLVRAQEDERRLIARELHDEVGQALTAVKMQLAAASRSLLPGETGAIDEARGVVDTALQSVRQLSRLLHPPMLDDLGLVSALDSYLSGFADRTGIRADLVHDGMSERPTPEIEIGLFRIVQEATTNIARHASAAACRVYVQRLPASVVLTVEDDGRGFDPQLRRPGVDDGLGLLSIQERVADMRGTFRIESAPGRGTRLYVEVPAVIPAVGDMASKEPGDGTHPAR
jgi:signal transduction histidine kinase